MIKIEMKLPRNPKKFKKKIEPIIKEIEDMKIKYPHILKDKDVELLINR